MPALAVLLAPYVVYIEIAAVVLDVGLAVYEVTRSRAKVAPSSLAGYTLTQASATANIPVIYGRMALAGGNLVFETVNGPNNEYLHQVYVWSEGEIDEVEAILVNNIPSTDARYNTGPLIGYYSYSLDPVYDPSDIVQLSDFPRGTTAQDLIDKGYTPIYGDPYILVNHHTGSDTQTVDADLLAGVPGQWTSEMVGSGIAYTYIRFTWNSALFNGRPTVQATVRGKLIYDPRTSTTGYSNNPALCIRDYLTNGRYGMGIPASSIDDNAIIAAANTCDTLKYPYSGATYQQAMFACDGLLDTSKSIQDNLSDLLTVCQGWLSSSEGYYRLLLDQDGTPDFTFDTDNIVGQWQIDWPGKQDLLNNVQANFLDADNSGVQNLAIYDSPSFRTQDNGAFLSQQITLPFTVNIYRAQDICALEVLASRYGIIATVVGTIATLRCRVGELVYVTHPTPGWTNKAFRVIALEIQNTGAVKFTLKEHQSAAYDVPGWTYYTPLPETGLPDPTIVGVPVGLTLDWGTDQLIIGSDGSIVSRILASWTAPADIYVVGYELQYKPTAWADLPVNWTTAARSSSADDTAAYITPVTDGTQYDVRVRSVNTLNFRSAWLQVSGYTAIGKSQPPPDVTNFLVSAQPDGTRQFTWTYPDPPVDLDGFEIRYGLGSGLTWSQLVPLQSAPITSSPFESNQLAAGTYTFAIAAVDTSGNYSVDPVYIDTTLPDPRLAGVLMAVYADQLDWPGTLTDCFIDNNNYLIAQDQKTWDDLTTDGIDWDAWTTWARNPYGTIQYDHPVIDLGAVTSFTPLITPMGNGTPTITVSTSTDGTTYSSYAAPALVTARYIKVRVVMTIGSPTGSNYPTLTSLAILLSGTPVSEAVTDLDTSTLTGSYRIGTGDVRIPITKTYAIIKTVVVTLQNVGSGWSYTVIDKNVSPGPQIKIYNGSGALADAVIDVTVTGL